MSMYQRALKGVSSLSYLGIEFRCSITFVDTGAHVMACIGVSSICALVSVLTESSVNALSPIFFASASPSSSPSNASSLPFLPFFLFSGLVEIVLSIFSLSSSQLAYISMSIYFLRTYFIILRTLRPFLFSPFLELPTTLI